MKFDLFGQLFGKALRRHIEGEVAKGGGPVLSILSPLITQMVQVELVNQIAKADSYLKAKTGIGNLAGLLAGAIISGNNPQAAK